jgi:serine phosphatase RsbU (regulator of sigma subunit)
VIEIDLARDRIVLTNAGHPPAYVIDTERGPHELLVSSLPVGSRLCGPKSIQHPFANGCRLLLYSDGLVEAASASGEPFGYSRLERILEKSAQLPGDELTAAILAALADHTNETPLADDLTVLVVERSA